MAADNPTFGSQANMQRNLMHRASIDEVMQMLADQKARGIR
jgi:hypothetical protein